MSVLIIGSVDLAENIRERHLRSIVAMLLKQSMYWDRCRGQSRHIIPVPSQFTMETSEHQLVWALLPMMNSAHPIHPTVRGRRGRPFGVRDGWKRGVGQPISLAVVGTQST